MFARRILSLLRHRRKKLSKMRRRPLIWLQLQVLVAMATDAAHHDNYTAPPVINVGLLQPLEGPLGFERTGSAATMAVRDAQRRGYLNETHVKYNYMHCIISWSCFSQKDLTHSSGGSRYGRTGRPPPLTKT